MPCSCRGRCFCPSCHQKRTLEKAGWVAEHICAEVSHTVTVVCGRGVPNDTTGAPQVSATVEYRFPDMANAVPVTPEPAVLRLTPAGVTEFALVSRQSDGSLVFGFHVESAVSFVLEESSDLAHGRPVSTNVSQGSFLWLTNPPPTDGNYRFYRAQIP